MLLNNKHIRQFAIFYLVCTILNYLWLWANGLLLTSIDPVFFSNKLDITRNLIMMTGIHQSILNNKALCLFFDIAYILFPIALCFAVVKNIKGKTLLAILTATFSLLYFMLVTEVSYLCIEGCISTILLPLIFAAGSNKAFYYYMHCLRILFLIIFFSSALWKVRTGAVFNTDQMSGILLLQHAAYLVSDSHNWFSRFIYFLVAHPMVSYCLYLFATCIELFFGVGLITRKMDKLLMVLFCLFLVFDYFLMRINYFNWLPLIGCLYFSRYPLDNNMKISESQLPKGILIS